MDTFPYIKLRILIWVLLLPILILGQSCTETSDPMFDYQATWKCHYEKDWTYESTKANIVGMWEWKYVVCCGETTSPYQNNIESEGLRIRFNTNGTGTLIDKERMEEFAWDIALKDNDMYGFQTIPSITQLAGRLLFCDNLMISNNAYIDGADNYFVKSENGENLMNNDFFKKTSLPHSLEGSSLY